MAFVLKDRVKQITDTVGTGTLSVTSVSTGYQTFSDAIGNGNTTYYAIYHENTTEWEVGLGTVGSGTLSRDTILASSNGGSLVNFTNGNKAVWCDYPASKAVYADQNNKLRVDGNPYVDLEDAIGTTVAAGRLWYDNGTGSLNFGMGGGNITQQIGEEIFVYGKASSAISDTNLQAIVKTGTVGASGVIQFAPATAGITDGSVFIGIATEDIAHNGFGRVTNFGVVHGINTTGSAYGETWADNDDIWYNPTTGGLTKVKPTAPNIKVQLGTVINAGSGGSGSFQVLLNSGSVLGGTDSNVEITSPTSGQQLVYNGTIWTNSNSPTITGGSINNTPIGATTPSTGSFTTLTAQTEVLKGTGQNLMFYSEQLQQSAYWFLIAGSVSTNATTAPDGTLTAESLIEDGTLNNHLIYQAVSCITGIPYTFSCYIKASARSLGYLRLGGAINKNAFFNLATGTVGVVDTGLTATITSAGNGWYRASVTYTPTSTGNINWAIGSAIVDGTPSYTGTNGTVSISIWGVQLELGSTANTYIPTTTTAVYGTPSLSFSGVAGIGLESNGSLYHQPAGTGAVQAQATTSSATGGNARGANAVDWQTSRSSAGQVASQSFATISGGQNNTASSPWSTSSGGRNNNSSANDAFVGGGNGNTAGGFAPTGAAVVAGLNNTANGQWNFVGGGSYNSGTSGSSVTTQSATMNGTTAVTLSGSNAAIKVGQYITGTSIAGQTYVAAISGTSLTLSQAASGSSTSTLSFYTPHGVVVGGGNNQATGSYSFIGGGGDAGTAANRNVASGDWSVVGGGSSNTASGLQSFVGGGVTNYATGGYSSTVGGNNNVASNTGATSLGGYNNLSNSVIGTTVGGRYGSTRGISGITIFSACNVPISNVGASQSALLILARQTTDATATVLASDVAAASTTNQVILPNNSAYYFKGSVIANVTGAANGAAWEISGAIMRGANAASTVLIGTPTVNRIAATAGASAWVITATADTTNGGLKVTVTGAAATTIRWVAQIQTTEVTF